MAFDRWMTNEKWELIWAKLGQSIGNKGPVFPKLDWIMDIVRALWKIWAYSMGEIRTIYRPIGVKLGENMGQYELNETN